MIFLVLFPIFISVDIESLHGLLEKRREDDSQFRSQIFSNLTTNLVRMNRSVNLIDEYGLSYQVIESKQEFLAVKSLAKQVLLFPYV